VASLFRPLRPELALVAALASPAAAQLTGPGAVTQPAPFLEDFELRRAPAVVTTGPALASSGGAAVVVQIETRRVTRLLPPALFGNNLALWTGDNDTLSGTLEDRLQPLRPGLLRFPGGNASNTYHWDGSYPPYAVSQGWDNQSNPWAVNTFEFLSLCERLGAEALLTVNHGYHEYDTTATDGQLGNAVALAADWVEYCNAPVDGSNPRGGIDWAAQRAADGHPEPFGVKYWEIGNEVHGFWTVGNEVADGAVYGAQYNAFHDAMKAVDPSIHIGIDGYVGDPAKVAWTAEVFSHPGTGRRIDFIDTHDYFHWVGHDLQNDLAEEDLFDLVDQIAQNKADLDALVEGCTRRRPGEIKYYMGEFNITHPVSYHATQLATALVVAEMLGAMIDTGYDAASLWLGFHAWSGTGDTGFLARNNPAVPDHTPYANYFVYWLFARNFGDRALAATSSDPEVVVHASRFASGELGLMLVNETSTPRTATLQLAGFSPSGPVNGWVLGGAGLEATAVTLNGVGSGLPYGGPLPDTVPALVGTADPLGVLSVRLEPHSLTSLLVY